ncbi:hypothetical protein CXG81DRAFT_17810 [Caulochytrium protostelioides]|uniref:Replication factor C subunit 5 n=1 Tax=Caulochytrium protostelioides TaxID=1555241 RepID=A0A4P9XAX1_9FUNG|nr:hypothetical protein CXG81DRAFT_17810 [Caulochytrium protostelioides]|eukprot:RKP02534.1 hypothetical protein CXG81DRAFT_17810 [Caulochytrium protostelioides]
MSLWVDKYRPSTLDDLDYHPDLTALFQQLASSGDFPHLLLYGPSGAGKKTRASAVLRQIYGPCVEKLKLDVRVFQASASRKLEINVLSSPVHIELTPSDAGIYDRVVVQDLIKELAQTAQVDPSARRAFKVVVINEADTLTRDAQQAMRRTMEKYMANLRIVLLAQSASQIMGPIRSRCLMVRVPAVPAPDVVRVLGNVAKQEGLLLPPAFADHLASAAEGNCRAALLALEAARLEHYPFSAAQPVPVADWKVFCGTVAQSILQEQSPARLMQIRGKLYELLAHCIPADMILKEVMAKLIAGHGVFAGPQAASGLASPSDLTVRVVQEAATAEHRLRQGSKPIFHLEAFVARVMSLYKRQVVELGL